MEKDSKYSKLAESPEFLDKNDNIDSTSIKKINKNQEDKLYTQEYDYKKEFRNIKMSNVN